MLSIVIPAFNEERFLPYLLKSVKRQKIRDIEVIVADNDSKDKTREIAKKFGCRIADGGSPGAARNDGARAARAGKKESLLFLDADVVLPDGFLRKFLERINKEGLDFATCSVEPLSSSMHHRFYYMLKNFGNLIFPGHISGQCMYVKKELFDSINGFDATLCLGEEHDFARRLKKKGKGKFFMDLFVYNHPRRLEKEGTYRTMVRDIYSELYRFFRPANRKIHNKRYGHY